jgi:cytoskeletal protein CcmA (bactofilin family)
LSVRREPVKKLGIVNMFAKKTTQPSIEVSKLSSLIAEDMVFTGDLAFSTGVRVDGCIKGNITALPASDGSGFPLLVLSEKGRIEGNIRCGDAVINGTVIGDVHSDNFLELQPNASVQGTIRYQRLHMEVGASVRGQLMQLELAAADNVLEFSMDKPAVNQ